MSSSGAIVASTRAGASLRAWLQQLIRERISEDLTLQLDSGAATYRLVHAGRSIEMPAWEWRCGEAVTAHCWCDVTGEGWNPAVGRRMPAPGAETLPQPLVEKTEIGYYVGYDILGMSCWMLSRAEEAGRAELDEHGRFPATASHGYRHGYLQRPVVDEWLDLLKQVACRLWPGLRTISLAYRLSPSHDVDEPSAYAFGTAKAMLRSVGGDLIKRKDILAACRRPVVWLGSARGLRRADPNNTFGWIMSASERRQLKSTFNFVSGRTDLANDPRYDIEHSAIRRLLREIHRRGHAIGLHPSYGSSGSRDAIREEAERLMSVCAEEGIRQQALGARMHYLRLRIPETLYLLEQAGCAYDNTLGYSAEVGFRCGTCIEYQAFDPLAGRPLALRIRPLIAMETTLFSSSYMALGVSRQSLDVLLTLKQRCRAVDGTFSVLWHNDALVTHASRELYLAMLDY